MLSILIISVFLAYRCALITAQNAIVNVSAITEYFADNRVHRGLYALNQPYFYAATGQPYTFNVPTGVTSIYVEAFGAAGGNCDVAARVPGYGAFVSSTLSVTPGSTLTIYIGGMGTTCTSSSNVAYSGGFNGGGAGWQGGGGGGATDLRVSPNGIGNRILVAGGGGGCAGSACTPGANGGNAGHPSGQAGATGPTCQGGAVAGGGGTDSAGGTGTCNSVAASAGVGGACNNGCSGNAFGGGGGSGYYGGGAGYRHGGGGGGSSYSSGTGTTHSVAASATHGSLVIYYDPPPTDTPTVKPTTIMPTQTPTVKPTTTCPTITPSALPTVQPTTTAPTVKPTMPTSQPSGQPSRQPTNQPSQQPTGQPSRHPTSQPTHHPSMQPSLVPSRQPTAQPSIRPSMQPSSEPTSPTSQPTCQPTNQPSSRPSRQPSQQPSRQPSSLPTNLPSVQPSGLPSSQPSKQPSRIPSQRPSTQPTGQPFSEPSALPSQQPSIWPSAQPSCLPTAIPSVQPSTQPSCSPSVQPTDNPACQPTGQPSAVPSSLPSSQPSVVPSTQPSMTPSTQPTVRPTSQPSIFPSAIPSSQPSCQPSNRPSSQPSSEPTSEPTSQPSISPTSQPSQQPTSLPSIQPSNFPSNQPSTQPFAVPSYRPSSQPTFQPTAHPSSDPSSQPSVQPSSLPSSKPSTQPSIQPSSQPSKQPSCQPTANPSGQPSNMPTIAPSGQPSCRPSGQPSSSPSYQPTRQPTVSPTLQPSEQPSKQPTSQPTVVPSQQPLAIPTMQPSSQPSKQPSYQPSSLPSRQPVSRPSNQPSRQPSSQPSKQPTRQPSSRPSRQPFSAPSSHPSSMPSESPLAIGGIKTPRPTALPTFKPTSLPTIVPTIGPTSSPTYGILPRRDVIHVRYKDVNATRFKIVLPFLFTEPVFGDGFYNVTVAVPTDGNSYMLLGSSAYETNEIGVEALPNGPFAVGYDFSGRSVGNAGDMNGDGFDDLIIGVPYANLCYLLYGNANGFVNMTTGFTIFGVDPSDLTGWSVSGAGDVNNDTYADIIIGAPNAVHNGTRNGAVYVIYGGRTSDLIFLGRLLPGQAYVVYGAHSQDCLGLSVSGAGDVNGDGYADIIMGVLQIADSYAGSVYVLYGQHAVFAEEIGLLSLTASVGFRISGTAYSWFGYSVSDAGDVNGDGLDDTIVGSAPRRDGVGVPVSYLIYGNRNMSVHSVSSLKVSQGVVITGGGVMVSGLGDLNGDGFDEIAMLANVNLDIGAGLVVWTPDKIPYFSHKPTLMPTTLRPSKTPSVRPSRRPSHGPTAVPSHNPTRPTVVPTLAPSGPTMLPTVSPTQPTMRPSMIPTAPSITPTISPTESPSEAPSAEPSESPSITPSMEPTSQPSSADPTVRPTPRPTQIPSKGPVSRPSLSPSVAPSFAPSRNETAGHYYTESVDKIGGVIVRDRTAINYVVNTSQPVWFVGSGVGDMFTVIPNVNSLLTLSYFDTTLDVINLEAFVHVLSVEDLDITVIRSTHRRLSESQVTVAINLGNNQRILFPNNTETQVREARFVFYTPLSDDYVEQENDTQLSLIVGVTICGVILLAIVYKLYAFLRVRYKYMQFKSHSVLWEDIKRNNRTYIEWVHQDSLHSIESKESDTDSSDNTDSSNTDSDVNDNDEGSRDSWGLGRRSSKGRYQLNAHRMSERHDNGEEETILYESRDTADDNLTTERSVDLRKRVLTRSFDFAADQNSSYLRSRARVDSNMSSDGDAPRRRFFSDMSNVSWDDFTVNIRNVFSSHVARQRLYSDKTEASNNFDSCSDDGDTVHDSGRELRVANSSTKIQNRPRVASVESESDEERKQILQMAKHFDELQHKSLQESLEGMLKRNNASGKQIDSTQSNVDNLNYVMPLRNRFDSMASVSDDEEVSESEKISTSNRESSRQILNTMTIATTSDKLNNEKKRNRFDSVDSVSNSSSNSNRNSNSNSGCDVEVDVEDALIPEQCSDSEVEVSSSSSSSSGEDNEK